MHATLQKFGHPSTLLRDYQNWCILMRPNQVTLGSLVLCAKSESSSFGTLPGAAYAELGVCTRHIERALQSFRPYSKINYLALMMVDPHVHFHVLPRYEAAPEFDGQSFPDLAWPGPPDLKQHVAFAPETLQALHARLLDDFSKVV